MPLTKLGKMLEKKFEQQYGSERGKRVFYGYEHKHPEIRLIKKK